MPHLLSPLVREGGRNAGENVRKGEADSNRLGPAVSSPFGHPKNEHTAGRRLCRRARALFTHSESLAPSSILRVVYACLKD